MAFAQEFKDYLKRGNVVDLAVAVVIGVAFVIFVVFVKGMARFQHHEPPEAPATKDCPMGLEKLALAARRCKHCTSEV